MAGPRPGRRRCGSAASRASRKSRDEQERGRSRSLRSAAPRRGEREPGSRVGSAAAHGRGRPAARRATRGRAPSTTQVPARETSAKRIGAADRPPPRSRPARPGREGQPDHLHETETASATVAASAASASAPSVPSETRHRRGREAAPAASATPTRNRSATASQRSQSTDKERAAAPGQTPQQAAKAVKLEGSRRPLERARAEKQQRLERRMVDTCAGAPRRARTRPTRQPRGGATARQAPRPSATTPRCLDGREARSRFRSCWKSAYVMPPKADSRQGRASSPQPSREEDPASRRGHGSARRRRP